MLNLLMMEDGIQWAIIITTIIIHAIMDSMDFVIFYLELNILKLNIQWSIYQHGRDRRLNEIIYKNNFLFSKLSK